MYKIVAKKIFNSNVFEMEIEAPLIAAKAKAGQFCILMTNENGERVPFTLADWNIQKGTITLVIQVLGKTSQYLMNESIKELPHVTGPLGIPSIIDLNVKNAAFVGGGLGVAALYPIMREYYQKGIQIDCILGFRSKDLIFWEEKMKEQSSNLILTTDDGSFGLKGRVTDALEKLLNEKKIDVVYAIGPLVMMKAVSEVTQKTMTKTFVSLNPIMVDGIGMCGACRVTVNGETRYACVEGPEFEAHQVDFNELILKNSQFKESEEKCYREYVFRNKNK